MLWLLWFPVGCTSDSKWRIFRFWNLSTWLSHEIINLLEEIPFSFWYRLNQLIYHSNRSVKIMQFSAIQYYSSFLLVHIYVFFLFTEWKFIYSCLSTHSSFYSEAYCQGSTAVVGLHFCSIFILGQCLGD